VFNAGSQNSLQLRIFQLYDREPKKTLNLKIVMEYVLDPEYYPAPFPSEGLQTFELQRISLAKLLDGDYEEGKRVFNICSNEGFFYLDLTTHPKGIELLEYAHRMHHMGRDAMTNTSLSEKREFPIRPAYIGLLDTGYVATGRCI
jgi:hypothetical protein